MSIDQTSPAASTAAAPAAGVIRPAGPASPRPVARKGPGDRRTARPAALAAGPGRHPDDVLVIVVPFAGRGATSRRWTSTSTRSGAGCRRRSSASQNYVEAVTPLRPAARDLGQRLGRRHRHGRRAADRRDRGTRPRTTGSRGRAAGPLALPRPVRAAGVRRRHDLADHPAAGRRRQPCAARTSAIHPRPVAQRPEELLSR